MSTAPSPRDVYEQAVEEGRRRLAMSGLERVSTGFIAGVTIVFGIVALGVVEALAQPTLGSLARVVGALAFGVGVVFLVIGRTELFTENFFDPVAAAIDEEGSRPWAQLLRLWGTTLVLNLVGGAVLVGIMTVPGALPGDSVTTLVHLAEEIAGKAWTATIARALMAGALLTLLSYLLNAARSVSGRIMVAYMVGFVLALGPFDHVVVSALHLLFGMWLGGEVALSDLLANLGLATVGNLVGGLLLITLTHTAQVRGERE